MGAVSDDHTNFHLSGQVFKVFAILQLFYLKIKPIFKYIAAT